ncbi:MAG: hypothetical protein NVS9B12_09920 [Vulcanimicrobiaceae bacterium]
MKNNLKISDVAQSIHPYPTYSTGVQLLASDVALAQLLQGVSGRLLRAASKVIR